MRLMEINLKVSVILTVFNGENVVSKAIESILNQTFRNFEFIIVDDGSQDKSLEIIKNYAKKDERIRIIKNNTNIGLTRSLNNAIRQSNGEYIIRQDVDDISLPKRIELQLKFLQKNPEYAFCGCNGPIKQNNQELLIYFEYDEILHNLVKKNCFAHPTIAIRKNILTQYGFYDENFQYGQDYELWCKLILYFHLKAKNLSEKLTIINMPQERLLMKDRKFLIQRKNAIKTKVKYLRYTNKKIRGIISIFKYIMEICFVIIFKGINKNLN